MSKIEELFKRGVERESSPWKKEKRERLAYEMDGLDEKFCCATDKCFRGMIAPNDDLNQIKAMPQGLKNNGSFWRSGESNQ